MKDFPTDPVEQIDALLYLNSNGCLTSPIPGLAVDLLKKYRALLAERSIELPCSTPHPDTGEQS